MRMTLAGDDLLERIGVRANVAPVAVGLTFFGMPVARAIGIAQKTGIFGELVRRSATPDELAAALDLRSVPTRMLLECLAGERVLDSDGGRYSVAKPMRRWLDPSSARYIGTYLEHTADYWAWWGDLERLLRAGEAVDIHGVSEDDPSWPVYIRGQYELARLSAPEIARAIDLPARPTSLLDVAGGHGWFAAELCRRHPGMQATVVDLAGSAAVGREIIAEAGMSDRVAHRVGDMFEIDLEGPHDGALAFDIVHHLSLEQVVTLFTRVREALKPGGTLAVLDMFRDDDDGARPRASASAFRLFFHLTSGADILSRAELLGCLERAGFVQPKRLRVRSMPDQSLYQAKAG